MAKSTQPLLLRKHFIVFCCRDAIVTQKIMVANLFTPSLAVPTVPLSVIFVQVDTAETAVFHPWLFTARDTTNCRCNCHRARMSLLTMIVGCVFACAPPPPWFAVPREPALAERLPIPAVSEPSAAASDPNPAVIPVGDPETVTPVATEAAKAGPLFPSV